MPVATVTLFFALLAFMATGFSVVLVALVFFDRKDSTGLLTVVQEWGSAFAAVVAGVSMLGSLYLSEVALFDPCRLCWVQRGFMYPAAFVLAAAAFTKRRSLTVFGGLLALGGLPVALFHRYEQARGPIGNVCDPAVPCSHEWVTEFGFITIPTMAAVGFAAAFTLVAVQLFWRKQ